MSWREVTLKDISTTQYGYTASAKEEGNGRPKFLRITDIVNSSLDWSTVPHCDIKDSLLQRYKLKKGDIVVARTGNTTGYAKLIRDVDDAVFASYLVKISVNRDVANPDFVGRLIESDIYKSFVRSIKGGAAQGNANAKTLSLFRFKLPPLDTQTRIADILSAYDDIIENNRQRIALLEQAARLLYREWFVYLRFPGHEHNKVIDGVPEGWKLGAVSDFYDTSSGGTPSRKNASFFNGDIYWVKTQELLNGFVFKTEETITEDAIKKSSAKVFPIGTILIAMYGATIGQTGILAVPAASNQACCAVIPKMQRANNYYAYWFFRQNQDVLKNLSQGAAQNNINQQIIKKFPMVMPTTAIMDAFFNFSEPIMRQINILEYEVFYLQQARDLLLSRLMNGEIAV